MEQFAPLVALKTTSKRYAAMSIISRCLQLELASIVKAKSDKLFANFMALVNELLRVSRADTATRGALFDPDEFYTHVVEAGYFGARQFASYAMFKALLVYESIHRHMRTVSVAQLAFVMRLFTHVNMSLGSGSGVSTRADLVDILLLKEKCAQMTVSVAKQLEANREYLSDKSE